VISKDLIDYFPGGYTPRRVQKSTLGQLSAALSSSSKFILFCAPTGSGKSFISKTISNSSLTCQPDIKKIIKSHRPFMQNSNGEYHDQEQLLAAPPHGCTILTITKALQDQYLEFFKDISVLKGKANYRSGIDSNLDVEIENAILPRRLVEEHQLSGKCPYCNARAKALTDQSAILNYKVFLTLPDHVKRKHIIVCDEASELEDELVQRFSASVEYTNLKKLKISHPRLTTVARTKAKIWLGELLNAVEDRLKKLSGRKNQSNITANDVARIKLFKNLYNSLRLVDAHWYDCEYIIEKDSESVQFTPLKVNTLSHHLFDFADKVILMSATIINHKNFAKTLGITDYKYIEAKSTFNPKKSPIYISTKYRLNHKNLYKVLPKIVNQIKGVLEEHSDEKGVIHTHSHAITNFLKDKLSSYSGYGRLLFRESGVDNIDILNTHESTSDPTVLVSPSLVHGVDLKDGLSRFQIIVKLPYLPLGSKRIKALFDNDKQWYEGKMLGNLVQAAGRSTRSVDDHSITYILDGNIRSILDRSSHKLPKHFISRFM
jgi:Rad3-related DNA helicase